MNVVGQIFAVTAINLRSIPLRLGSSLVIVIGIAGVVGVLIPVLAMSTGFRSTIKGDARDDRAIAVTRVATAEYESSISRDDFGKIANAQEVRRDARGRPMASGEVVLQTPVSRRRDHTDVSITLRGVSDQYFAMRPELKLVSGRLYEAGKQELVVGAAALTQFEGLEIGDSIRLQEGDWTIVGTYAGGDGARESEVISDALTLMSAYKLNAFNSVTVALEGPESFASFKAGVLRDTRSIVEARTEADYLEGASSWVNRMLRIVTYSIGAIMALGALFGALNSMYSAVAARAVEMATLRAIGFSASAVAAAIMLEALLLALLGTAIGAGVSYSLFDGATISTLGGALFDSQLVYSLSITPALMSSVALIACSLGLLGGIVPAVFAARSNIAVSLHET